MVDIEEPPGKLVRKSNELRYVRIVRNSTYFVKQKKGRIGVVSQSAELPLIGASMNRVLQPMAGRILVELHKGALRTSVLHISRC